MPIFKKILTLTVAIASFIFVHAQKLGKPVPAKEFKVTGVVVNAATGKPILGIRIKYKTFAASISNNEGNFTITLPSDEVIYLPKETGTSQKKYR